MKNKEKFAKEILDITCKGIYVAVCMVTQKPRECIGISCKKCYLYKTNYPGNKNTSCRENFAHWAKSEYKEKKEFSEADKAYVKAMDKLIYGDSANCYSRENFAECEAIADTVDALIAAGIGDVSELQKECEYWKDKAKEYKHRAEVAERAERALDFLCNSTLKDCDVLVFKDGIQVKNKVELYHYCMKQAEKELQEERKE